MNLQSIRDRLDVERRSLVKDDEVAEVLPLVTRIASADGSWHCIAFSALANENADTVIAQQVSHYRMLDVEVEWKAYRHDEPVDLVDRLLHYGFEIGAHETVMVLELGTRPAWLCRDATHSVLQIKEPSQLELYRRAEMEIFPAHSDATIRELSRGIRNGSSQHLGYIALEEGRAVSIGRLYTHPNSDFAGLYGGGTLASHRGRGLYRAMVAARARDALKLGARYLIVDALPTSRPILERLGFVALTETWPCVLRRAQTLTSFA